jgi:transposase-like protein
LRSIRMGRDSGYHRFGACLAEADISTMEANRNLHETPTAMTFDAETSTSHHEALASESPRSAREFSLAEKLRIVHEANTPGVKFRYVERKYGLGKNVLAYWRRAYGGLSEAVISNRTRTGEEAPEVVALRLQVERLERLLGQKTLELELLRLEAPQ